MGLEPGGGQAGKASQRRGRWSSAGLPPSQSAASMEMLPPLLLKPSVQLWVGRPHLGVHLPARGVPQLLHFWWHLQCMPPLSPLDTFLLTVAWHQANPCHLPEATTTRVSSRPTGPTKTLLYSLLTTFTDPLRVATGRPHLLDWQSLPTKATVCSPHTAPHCLISGLPSCLLPAVIFSHLLISSIHATPASSSFRSRVPGAPGSLL